MVLAPVDTELPRVAQMLGGEGDLRREARIGGLLRHRCRVDMYEVAKKGEY